MRLLSNTRRVWTFQRVSSVGRFTSQLNHLSKIPFEILCPPSRRPKFSEVNKCEKCLHVCACSGVGRCFSLGGGGGDFQPLTCSFTGVVVPVILLQKVVIVQVFHSPSLDM